MEQKALEQLWGVSRRTVQRVMRRFCPRLGIRPAWHGQRPVVTLEQARALEAAWQADLERSARRVSRRMRQIWKARAAR